MHPKEAMALAASGKLEAVEVWWGDAWGDGDWVDSLPTSGESAISVSVGYLLAQDDDGIVLVSLLNNHSGAYVLVIPMGMVHRIVRLKRRRS